MQIGRVFFDAAQGNGEGEGCIFAAITVWRGPRPNARRGAPGHGTCFA